MLKLSDDFRKAVQGSSVPPSSLPAIRAADLLGPEYVREAELSLDNAYDKAAKTLLAGYAPGIREEGTDLLLYKHDDAQIIQDAVVQRLETDRQTRLHEKDNILGIAKTLSKNDYSNDRGHKLGSVLASWVTLSNPPTIQNPSGTFEEKLVYHGQPAKADIEINVTGATIEVDSTNWTGRGFNGFSKPKINIESVAKVFIQSPVMQVINSVLRPK